MRSFGDETTARRATNAKALAAFGVEGSVGSAASEFRTVREGNGTKVFTIGYERRDGPDLVSRLVQAGVTNLVDVRERPMSRKADFRKSLLEERCRAAGVTYESWPELGSTNHQRRQLWETGNVGEFRRRYRDFARRYRADALDALARVAAMKTVALLCYERRHEQCHRGVVADLLADRIDATIVAIV